MKIDPNAPAFPASNAQCCGLTIRAEIAARVMAATIGGYAASGSEIDDMCANLLAKESARMADALIAELNQEAV